jgi:hypothetical protein
MIKETRRRITYGILFIALFILVILSLTFSLADLDSPALTFSLDKVGSMMGIFVSAVALVITVYFVVLAIDAYSHVQIIKESTKKMNTLFSDYVDTMYDILELQISLATKSQEIKSKDILKLRQARLSYQYPMLNEEIRIKLLLNLSIVGELQDIKHLENIIRNEQGEIKFAAELVLEELKKRLNIA